VPTKKKPCTNAGHLRTGSLWDVLGVVARGGRDRKKKKFQKEPRERGNEREGSCAATKRGRLLREGK